MAMRLSDQKVKERNSGRLSRRTKIDLLCFLVIILVGTFFFMGDHSENSLSWDDTQLVLMLPDETAYTIPFAEITHVTLAEDVDFGSCLSGEDSSNRLYGIWENEALGEYVLSAYRKSTAVMQISTAREDYLIALEDDDTTAAFAEAFVKMLEDAGYEIA